VSDVPDAHAVDSAQERRKAENFAGDQNTPYQKEVLPDHEKPNELDCDKNAQAMDAGRDGRMHGGFRSG
jgi:hypothetical protein